MSSLEHELAELRAKALEGPDLSELPPLPPPGLPTFSFAMNPDVLTKPMPAPWEVYPADYIGGCQCR